MIVAVGSTNPTKIKAVRTAFKRVFSNEKLIVKGFEVKSGISHQPMSDDESIRGARNRAKYALSKLNADFGVGAEGGLQKTAGIWFDCGWIVVIDRKGREGIGSSIKMHTPEKMMVYVRRGTELGHVDDIMFGKKNSKHQEGHFGLMTKGAISRAHGYKDGVISALARFLHKNLY